MEREEITAGREQRQIHEEDFVEAALAQHFGRKRGNIVRRRGEEDARLTVLHPGEKRGEQALREARVGIAARTRRGEGLFYFVDPENQRRHFLRQVESFAKSLFAFTDEFVVERACIETSELESPFAGYGPRGQAFTAALHA